jgi:hypothetical protein
LRFSYTSGAFGAARILFLPDLKGFKNLSGLKEKNLSGLKEENLSAPNIPPDNYQSYYMIKVSKFPNGL